MIRRFFGNAFVVFVGIAVFIVAIAILSVLAGFVETFQPIWRLRGQ